MALRPFRILRLLGLVVVLAYWAWNYPRAQRELREARKEWEELQAKRQALVEQVAQLRREVESLERDAESRSRAARELLGVAGTQEKVVILSQP
ncbi:MAG: septum formation initiator family protein [Acidobacteriota bacterium]